MKRIAYIILPLLLSGLHATAKEAETQTVRFTAYCLKGDLNEVSYLSADKIHSFKVDRYRRSVEQMYRGQTEMVFFSGGLNEQGQPVNVIARTGIRPELKRPLLLFAETAKGYAILQVEDDILASPAGSIRFMNLSGSQQTLFIGIGEDAEFKQQIQPRGIARYQMQAEDAGNLRIRIARLTEKGSDLLRDMRIFPNTINRYIYFIFQPDPDKARFTIKMLAEKPTPYTSNPEDSDRPSLNMVISSSQ